MLDKPASRQLVDTESREVQPGRSPIDDPVLGEHPSRAHPIGEVFSAADSRTVTLVAHRALEEREGKRPIAVETLRSMLGRHHVSPEELARRQQRNEALQRLGSAVRLPSFPRNPSTRKGNLAEIVLAEYLAAATPAKLPVYRLRYNTNIDQSMKGDDVLAFDLDCKPPRVIIGESKFRRVSSAAAVKEIVQALVRSHLGVVPVSLTFVAERLYASEQEELGRRVLDCALAIATGEIRLDYVGLLLSDRESSARVHSAAENSLHRLAMISLGVDDPNSLVDACYRGLE